VSQVFSKVLCALDLGPNSGSCLAFAHRLAQGEGKLILFHAVPMPVEALGQPVLGEPLAGAEHDAREGLKRLAADASLKDVEIAVAIGDPASEIVRAAREHDCDLIAIASHGRTGIGHLLLGSVAERVIRESSVPVVTIKSTHKGHPIAASSILI